MGFPADFNPTQPVPFGGGTGLFPDPQLAPSRVLKKRQFSVIGW
jgi:hypothetical protein